VLTGSKQVYVNGKVSIKFLCFSDFMCIFKKLLFYCNNILVHVLHSCCAAKYINFVDLLPVFSYIFPT